MVVKAAEVTWRIARDDEEFIDDRLRAAWDAYERIHGKRFDIRDVGWDDDTVVNIQEVYRRAGWRVTVNKSGEACFSDMLIFAWPDND